MHLYGQMADMDPIMEIAARHDLIVIEDAAEAHGAEYKGRRAGSIGHLGCFSFYFSKNLGAYGESGAVVTSDPELARRLRLYRDHGSEQRYHHQEYGFNSRMDEIQAAVLRIKLRYLDAWNVQRREHAATYDRLLANANVGLPVTAPERSHIYYLYVIRSADRDGLQQALADREIGTGIHFPIPTHLQVATPQAGLPRGRPAAHRAGRARSAVDSDVRRTDARTAGVDRRGCQRARWRV